MLAMALLLHGGLLGGAGGEAAGVVGSGEGAWTLATPAEGFLAASGASELAHLGIFLEKTNMNNDDWYPGCQHERDILEDKGKVPRHVRFELNDHIREAGIRGEWWRMGEQYLIAN